MQDKLNSPQLKLLRQRLKSAADYLHIDVLATKQKELAEHTTKQDFWDDPASARQVTRELAAITDSLDLYSTLDSRLSDAEVLAQLLDEQSKQSGAADATSASSTSPNLESEFQELKETVIQLEADMDDLEVRALLSGEYDELDALCKIQSGAGGTDAQDWARMLLEMYERFAKDSNFSFELTSYQAAEGGGISSAEFFVRGSYAYGHLQAEHGVHRLVRISPFGKDGKRETSFASMNVVPLLEDSTVEIDEKDLRIDTYRSSGAGGQHVNVTDSAVRITHIPTGIVASCQAERSQLQNRQKAMEILVARLLGLQRSQDKKKIEEITGEAVGVDFGSQIRSYVIHPYQMVKDERTGTETAKVEDVLNGDIEQFIQSYLRFRQQSKD